MKIISYSTAGRVQKIRTSKRKRRVRVSFGPVAVPRDTGSAWFNRRYPDEASTARQGWLRRYTNSSGENHVKGKKVVYISGQQPKAAHKAPVKIKKGKYKPVTHKAYSIRDVLKGAL